MGECIHDRNNLVIIALPDARFFCFINRALAARQGNHIAK